MILRKDYVKLIQDGKAQVEVEKKDEHNEMLNIIFPKRVDYGYTASQMNTYFTSFRNHYYGYRTAGTPFDNLPIIHASDIILDNTVIKVESEEHGKKVIEWWEVQGVNTNGSIGSVVNSYYGMYNGYFNFFNYNITIKEHKKIITIPESSQEKPLEQTKQENKMKTITWEQGQELIDMVDISCSWKGKLLDLWAKTIVLKQEISVSEELLQQGRIDASQSQKEVIDRIFGTEKEDIVLVNGKGLGDYILFNKGMNKGGKTLICTPNINPNSFWLNSDFNWELKGNDLIVSHK